MLHFGAKPPFGIARFLELCKDQIPDRDFATIELCLAETLWEKETVQATLSQWQSFETALRNELSKVRASRKKVEPTRFLRGDGESEPAIFHIAMNSHRILSTIDSERFLDQARWQRLEELRFGHYFDLDALIVYALQLKILWRWETVARADKEALLTEVLAPA
jgi:hypothetical protein